jgi:hypothetical protein
MEEDDEVEEYERRMEETMKNTLYNKYAGKVSIDKNDDNSENQKTNE